MTTATTPVLEVEHVTMPFGGVVAIDDLSFRAMRGDITAIIGPNGAGKTTLFNCLTGVCRPPVGRMRFTRADGKSFLLERMDDFRIARDARILRTFQNVRLFEGMSALENLIVAQHVQLMRGLPFSLTRLLQLRRPHKTPVQALEAARYWLDVMGLTEFADEPAGTLPYGSQRRLEIARAMCARPELLCLDEPAAGLNPRETYEMKILLTDLRSEHGATILLVEHDMAMVMQVSDAIVVLDHGALIGEGTPQQVRNDPDVIRAYLGGPQDEEPARAVGAA